MFRLPGESFAYCIHIGRFQSWHWLGRRQSTVAVEKKSYFGSGSVWHWSDDFPGEIGPIPLDRRIAAELPPGFFMINLLQ